MIYEAMVHSAVLWLLENAAKPLVSILTVLLTTISGAIISAGAVISQLDLGAIDPGDVIGIGVGGSLLLFSVRFMRSVYMEALDQTRIQLDQSREDAAEDRESFRARIAYLEAENAQLRAQLEAAQG